MVRLNFGRSAPPPSPFPYQRSTPTTLPPTTATQYRLLSRTAAKMAENEDSESDWIKFKGRSQIWEYFLVKKDKSKVKCTLCKDTFAFHSATTTFWNHLSREHDIGPKGEKSKPSGSASRQPTIFTCMVKAGRDSLRKVLARLAAQDRISYRTIASSQDIREG